VLLWSLRCVGDENARRRLIGKKGSEKISKHEEDERKSLKIVQEHCISIFPEIDFSGNKI